MARKGWNNLSSSYRGKLERQGITKRGYESGKPLAKVAQASQRRSVDRFIRDYQRNFMFASEDWDELRQELRDMSPREAKRAMELQREAQRLYDRGEIQRARRLWERRDRNLPDWMFYYHGAWGGGS